VERGILRVATINTHRGEGPKLHYLLDGAEDHDAQRIRLLHDTRAYAYHIADWLRRRQRAYDVIGLQEVFGGSLLSPRRWMPWRARQREYYRVLCGYGTWAAHSVGFAGFRYENLLLSRLAPASAEGIQKHLPCRVFRLAACGFTLAPFRFQERTVWIGNTHLHAYNPRARARQAASIAREIRALGDVPVIFLGDINTVPPGCKDGNFPHGDRDVNSYRGDRTFDFLERAGLRTVEHLDEEQRWTYPTGIPNRTLDYVLFSRHFEVRDYRVVREFRLSDHYPVEATLQLVG
jgi:endonuclease/exonuclease/phosphatase family metal-dependent hydrolase